MTAAAPPRQADRSRAVRAARCLAWATLLVSLGPSCGCVTLHLPSERYHDPPDGGGSDDPRYPSGRGRRPGRSVRPAGSPSAVRAVASGEESPLDETVGPGDIARPILAGPVVSGPILAGPILAGPVGMGLPAETEWSEEMGWPEEAKWPPGETSEAVCDAACLVEERPGGLAWPVLPVLPEFCWPRAKAKKEKAVPWPSYHPVPTRPVFSPRPVVAPRPGVPGQPPKE